jgi:hypothetical protein
LARFGFGKAVASHRTPIGSAAAVELWTITTIEVARGGAGNGSIYDER